MEKIVEPGTYLESVLLSLNGSRHASGSSCFSAKGESRVQEKPNFEIKPRTSSQEVLCYFYWPMCRKRYYLITS